jgi:acetyl esterase
VIRSALAVVPEAAYGGQMSDRIPVAHDGDGVLEIAHINRAGTPVGLYRPGGAEGSTLYIHGGAWVLGGLESYEDVCCDLARRSSSIVASIDYSLAPEGQHPAQIREVMAVLRYLRRTGRPVALAGDGVGAYLAVQTAAAALRRGIPLAGLALIYPLTGPPRAGGGAPGGAQWDLYRAAAPDPADPSLWLEDLELRGLPSTMLLAAEGDPARGEAERLRALLAAADVEVELLTHPGPAHDFLVPRPPRPEVDAALAEVADYLAPRLGVQPLMWQTYPPGGSR